MRRPQRHVGQKLRVGVLDPPPATLNPYDPVDPTVELLARQVYQRPYRLQPDGTTLVPEVFDAPLERRNDRLIARIRPGAAFSDGSPVTPNDVVRAITRAKAADRFASVESDGQHICIQARITSAAAVERELAKPWYAITKSHNGALLGSGPFCVGDRHHRDAFRLVRNPSYSGTPPAVDEVLLSSYKGRSPEQLSSDLAGGRFDVCLSLDRHVAERLRGIRRAHQPGNSTAILWINTDRIPSAKDREGLTSAIDRYELVRTSYDNAISFVARSPLPPLMGTARDGIRFDPTRAQTVLRGSALLERPLELTVIWGPRPYLPDPRRWAERIVQQLGKVGLRVNASYTTDADDYQGHICANRYDMLLGGWNAETADPSDVLDDMFSSNLIPHEGERPRGCNFGRWSNPQTDQALAEFRRDPSAKTEAAVITSVGVSPPCLALAYGANTLVYSASLQGLGAGGRPEELDLSTLWLSEVQSP